MIVAAVPFAPLLCGADSSCGYVPYAWFVARLSGCPGCLATRAHSSTVFVTDAIMPCAPLCATLPCTQQHGFSHRHHALCYLYYVLYYALCYFTVHTCTRAHNMHILISNRCITYMPCQTAAKYNGQGKSVSQ